MANISFSSEVDISVVIPTYNNQHDIERCIEESLCFFRSNLKINKFEILFASDRGNDNTIEIIKNYLKENPELILIENRTRLQKGGSIRKAMLKTRYPIKLFYDVDLSTPLEEVNNFLEIINNYDIIIGSRRLNDSKVKKSFFKKFLSTGFSILNRLVLGLSFNDTQCGFKMFKQNSLDLFKKQRLISSAFDVEILFLAKKMDLRVKEQPITWIDAETSQFNILQAVISLFRDTIKVRLDNLKKLYN